MTEPAYSSTKRQRKIRLSPSRILFGALTLFTLAVILRNAEVAIRQMNYGLRLCVTSVIPSLFPFMVLSELLLCVGAIRPIGKLLSRPFRFLFDIGEESVCALLLGWLCGFPVGPRCALSLYRQGHIDHVELSRLLCFSNLPSSAFLISTVGISLFGDRSFGIYLYGITLCSAILLGILGNLLHRKQKKTQSASASFFRPSTDPIPSLSGIRAFSEAVGSSALALLRICAFIVFFSVFVGSLEYLISGLSLSPTASALLFGIFEMTGGTARAAALSNPYIGEIVCMLLVGWSGISVHCQLISLCSDASIPLRPYLLAKVAHGILNVLLWIAVRSVLL